MNNEESYFPNFRFDSNNPPIKEWQKIFETKERKKYSRKTTIIKQGQTVTCLYYIVNGMIEYTYTCADGSQEMLEVLGAGNIFGLQPIYGQNPAIGSFVTLEDSVIAIMTVGEMNRHIDKNMMLLKELLAELSKITGGLIRQLYERSLSAEQRVEKVIYLIAEYKKRTSLEQKKIRISICQDDLARITRTTRVTIAKVLAELKRQQLVETSYGEILISNLESFKKKLY